MKPPFAVNYDADNDVLYVFGSDNRSAVAQDHPIYGEGCLLRFADDTGVLVGATFVGTQWKKEPADRIEILEAKLRKAKQWAQLQIAHPGCLPDAKALLEMLERPDADET